MGKSTLYSQDFLQWTQEQIDSLRHGRWSDLDIENLIEELEELGRSEQRELGSYLRVLMMHLLKWQYQPERRTASWQITITNFRDSIQDCLEDAPSLQQFVNNAEWRQQYYKRARRDAAKETNKALTSFPEKCPYLLEQLVSSDWLPE
ncbi:protein of unknown function DUF29 [Leptolyngbya sp. PCC 7375]|nr:protein of unknown function DUF29 [Leptolyngbya sp. PCC 7375]